MKIEALKEELRIARKERDHAISRVKEIEKTLAKAISEEKGITIGDKVQDGDGKTWVVKDIGLLIGNLVDYRGFRIKKNGELDPRLCSIFRNPITKVED
jgi:hypothetical protein